MTSSDSGDQALSLHGVKAVIYTTDGRILMQQRDDNDALPFAGCWNFFGGLADAGESPLDAIRRELTEELGGVPGELGPELFAWTWHSGWSSTHDHFFPIQCDASTGPVTQHEGQAMAWFALEDLIALPLTPAVYENVSRLGTFIERLSPGVADRLEARLLAVNNLERKNNRVFYARENPCALSWQQMVLLKELACLRQTPTFRVCLHTDDQNDIHEMLMVHTVPTSVGPLKQHKTSLSYHVLQGSLTIKLYDDQGAVRKEFLLGEGRPAALRAASLRLRASEFRSVHSTSPAIFLEIASGPFRDSDTVWFNT